MRWRSPGKICLLVFCLLFWGCTTKPQIVKTKALTPAPGCISGKVVNAIGKPLGGVNVQTLPKTNVTVTDNLGTFAICHRRRVVDKDVGRSVQLPLKTGKYVLKLGWNDRKVTSRSFRYDGKRFFFRLTIKEKELVFQEISDREKKKVDEVKAERVYKVPIGE